MKVHPITNCYPMMSAAEMAGLVADIRKRGLLFPVTVQGDTLIDGRNRVEACAAAGVELRTVEYHGDDAAGFIHSTNERRDLTTSQRAMVAAKIANLSRGNFSKAAVSPVSPTQAEAAAALKVNDRTIRSAKVVLSDPELAEKVSSGQVTVYAAEAQVRQRKRIAARKAIEEGTPPPAQRNKPAAEREKEITDLLAAGHNRAQVAEIIGVESSYVYKFMREHEMDMPSHAKKGAVRQSISATRVIKNTVEQLSALVPGLQIVRNGTIEISQADAATLLDEVLTALKSINWVTKKLREIANG